MKYLSICLFTCILAILAGISEGADLIEVVALKASSHANSDYNKTHLIDGSGLSVNGKHDGRYYNMWESAEFDRPTLTFDFGNIYSVERVDIWQYNYQAFDLLNDGVKDFIIYKSFDGFEFEQVKQASLLKSPGGYISAQTIELDCKARYIKFKVISNHGGRWTGLSEVQFWGILDSDEQSADIFGYEGNNIFVYQGTDEGKSISLEKIVSNEQRD